MRSWTDFTSEQRKKCYIRTTRHRVWRKRIEIGKSKGRKKGRYCYFVWLLPSILPDLGSPTRNIETPANRTLYPPPRKGDNRQRCLYFEYVTYFMRGDEANVHCVFEWVTEHISENKMATEDIKSSTFPLLLGINVFIFSNTIFYKNAKKI